MKDLKPLKLQKSEKDNPLKVRRVKELLKKLTPFLLIIGILMILAIFLSSSSGSTSITNRIFSGTSLKRTEGKVNILLLGIAGGIHDGSNLTDTIMVASYDLKTNKVYLLSIPRDLWLPSLKSKANAVYQIGLSQNNGLGLSKTIFGNVVGLPIHYALRIDFRGFTKAVDAIEGVDVFVDKPFDDYLYPVAGKETDMCGNQEKEMEFNEEEAKKLNIEPGKIKVLLTKDGQIATDSAEEDQGVKYFSCRYEHIAFDKGPLLMDGETALSFVRSRHGTNGEGSDFARSQRQQRVIEAIRDKVLSLETLSNMKKIGDLIEALGKSIDTDISLKDAFEFYKLSKKMDKTFNFVLDNSPKEGLAGGRKSLLIHPSAQDYGGAYVLISEDDDFSIVQDYVRKVITGEIVENDATASARTGN